MWKWEAEGQPKAVVAIFIALTSIILGMLGLLKNCVAQDFTL